MDIEIFNSKVAKMKFHLDAHDIQSLPKVWKEILEVTIKFITLEGRYSLVKGYHFTMLNHFIH